MEPRRRSRHTSSATRLVVQVQVNQVVSSQVKSGHTFDCAVLAKARKVKCSHLVCLLETRPVRGHAMAAGYSGVVAATVVGMFLLHSTSVLSFVLCTDTSADMRGAHSSASTCLSSTARRWRLRARAVREKSTDISNVSCATFSAVSRDACVCVTVCVRECVRVCVCVHVSKCMSNAFSAHAIAGT